MLWFQLVNLCFCLSTGVSTKTYTAVLIGLLANCLNLLLDCTCAVRNLLTICVILLRYSYVILCQKLKTKKSHSTTRRSLTCCVVSPYVVLSYATYYWHCTVLCFIIIHSCCRAIATHYHTQPRKTYTSFLLLHSIYYSPFFTVNIVSTVLCPATVTHLLFIQARQRYPFHQKYQFGKCFNILYLSSCNQHLVSCICIFQHLVSCICIFHHAIKVAGVAILTDF